MGKPRAKQPMGARAGLTITPKLKLREHARKTLLSSILKRFWPGNRRTTESTQMIKAPAMQALRVRPV